jgi:hypothetical protein
MTATFVGVDIAKEEFVVACRPERPGWTATHDAAGIAATSRAYRRWRRRSSCWKRPGAMNGRWSRRWRPLGSRLSSRIPGRCATSHANAIDDPECDGADEHDVAAERSARERLTLKTVAIVRQEPTHRGSLATKRFRAALDPDYLATLLAGLRADRPTPGTDHT